MPIEPSLRVRVSRHVGTEFIAVYGDGKRQYNDAIAMVRGAERVV